MGENGGIKMYEEQLSKMKESMKNSSDYFWLPARHVGVTALGKALLDGDINNKWRGIDGSAGSVDKLSRKRTQK